MDDGKPFKVIVVGGGVAGLTLANMFQKLDIDYTILEAYHDITPTVGASIGLIPNGLRILDQIGCFEPVAAFANEQLEYAYTRDRSGKPMTILSDVQEHVERRHGYPMLFFDRQWLLKALYGHLEDPSRVLVNKKVGGIQHIPGGVRVTTVEGETFDGSMVIGADGIHSTVRKELNRMAHELPPSNSISPSSSAFPPGQEDEIPCWYKCSFGTAQNVEGWGQRDQSHTFGEGHSVLVISGPQNRVYWFIFVRLPAVQRGKGIPKYTKEDEEKFAKEHADLPITETLRFSAIYAKKLKSTLTPLHEMVYKTWFYKRVVLLGDSAHKPNPISGQGGNGAIESAAELINALLEARAAHPDGLARLRDDADFARVFARMQAAREERARRLVRVAHDQQAVLAAESRLASGLAAWALAALPSAHWALLDAADTIVGAARIRALPVPHRPRAVPYEDERLAPPVRPRTARVVRWLYAGAVLAASVWAGTTAGTTTAPVGVEPVWQHVAPALMYTIEGHRFGHRGSLLGAPSAVAVGLHAVGVGRAVPAYALLHAFFAFRTPPDRHVPRRAARSILQSLVLGGVASAAKYVLDRHQGIPASPASALAPFSALFPALVWGFSKLYESGRKAEEHDGHLTFDQYKTDEMPYLRAVYACAFGLQAAAHMASGAPLLVRQTLLGTVKAVVANPSLLLASLPSLLSGGGLACAAWNLQNLYAVWDMRSLGYIKTFGVLKAALGVVLGQVLVGPGATWAALWSWRDEVFASSMMVDKEVA